VTPKPLPHGSSSNGSSVKPTQTCKKSSTSRRPSSNRWRPRRRWLPWPEAACMLPTSTKRHGIRSSLTRKTSTLSRRPAVQELWSNMSTASQFRLPIDSTCALTLTRSIPLSNCRRTRPTTKRSRRPRPRELLTLRQEQTRKESSLRTCPEERQETNPKYHELLLSLRPLSHFQ